MSKLRTNSQVRRKQRAADAKVRQAKYDSLTVEQKLALCEQRPGKSAREVARLTATIATLDTE